MSLDVAIDGVQATARMVVQPKVDANFSSVMLSFSLLDDTAVQFKTFDIQGRAIMLFYSISKLLVKVACTATFFHPVSLIDGHKDHLDVSVSGLF